MGKASWETGKNYLKTYFLIFEHYIFQIAEVEHELRHKFYFVLKLWEFARLFAAMACENLVFPPQKLNSDDILQRDTRGFHAAFSHLIP